MRRSILFVHSPLVGPSSLRRVADRASLLDAEVALPNLTPMARAEHPHEEYVERAATAALALSMPVAVVGHSGAGAFLPGIGAAIDQLVGLVFLDAILPPIAGPHRTPDSLARLLDEHTDDGVLRPWLEWWPPDVVDQLLPDPADRTKLAADMPRLPRAFYDDDVDEPAGWSERPSGYIQLSDAYDEEAADATKRGWPTMHLDSTHLGAHTDPSRVLDAILRILDQLS